MSHLLNDLFNCHRLGQCLTCRYWTLSITRTKLVVAVAAGTCTSSPYSDSSLNTVSKTSPDHLLNKITARLLALPSAGAIHFADCGLRKQSAFSNFQSWADNLRAEFSVVHQQIIHHKQPSSNVMFHTQFVAHRREAMVISASYSLALLHGC